MGFIRGIGGLTVPLIKAIHKMNDSIHAVQWVLFVACERLASFFGLAYCKDKNHHSQKIGSLVVNPYFLSTILNPCIGFSNDAPIRWAYAEYPIPEPLMKQSFVASNN